MSKSAASGHHNPLHQMTLTTPTCLWNDSASISELKYSLENGAVGATCNPVIVVGVLKKEFDTWKGRIQSLAAQFPTATEGDLAIDLPLASFATGEYVVEVTAKSGARDATDRLTFRVTS